jgi:hypothetical protein
MIAYHLDPAIAAEVAADAVEEEAQDLKAGLGGIMWERESTER